MDQQAQTKPSRQGAGPITLAATFFAVAGLTIGLGVAHNSGGVILIENGHPQAGLKVIDILGSSQAALDAELFVQVYDGNATMTKALLDRGAKFDWTTGGAAIVKQRPEILSLLLDKDASQVQSYLIGGIINKEGTVEILEVAKAHGAKVGGEALAAAAEGRPDLLPWVIANGTFAKEDVREAEIGAAYNGRWESFERLCALAPPDEATKNEILSVVADKPGAQEKILTILSGTTAKPAPQTFAPSLKP